MLQHFTPRLYQQMILNTAVSHNTLVVLPTGMGKTAIALMMAVQRLTQYPNSRILLLAPTKPLCEQHQETFRRHFMIPAEEIVLFTGAVSPQRREELWRGAKIVISTPQGLENDVINKRVRLEELSLIIFDEAHHASGDYAYVWLAQQYEKVSKMCRILALTASPGSDLEKIKELCQHLHIEKVEVRTEEDADVAPYVQEVEFKWIKVDFPVEYEQIQKHLKTALKTKLTEMQVLGYAHSLDMRKGELLQLQLELQKKVSGAEKEMEALRSLSLVAECMKIEHALELLESQGIMPLHKYCQKMLAEAVMGKTKAVKNLVQDPEFRAAVQLTEGLASQKSKHPKLQKLASLLQPELIENPQAKMIIFTQFRDSAETIVAELNELHITNHIFVGQAKKNGLGFSQKQQKEILDKFRGAEFNVLVATSVAEEGLDIPKVDKVIFYEPVPSAIRSIQRRGRTGRLERGEVSILVTANTRDEAYRWSSHHKEKKMHRHLQMLKKSFTIVKDPLPIEKKEMTLTKFIEENKTVTILADHREKDNRVVKELIELNVSVKTAQLVSADYILSGNLAVELKKIPDFVDSIIDGRLLEQLRELKKNFGKSVLVVEGEEDMYAQRKIHPQAIRGMIASVVLDFGIPILYTQNPKETALMLAIMARREQERGGEISLHERKPRTLEEQQEYFISSLPMVGYKTAKILLEHFGSIQRLVNATEEELGTIGGVGVKMAQRLREVFETEYEKKIK